jgi:hypothetical protein
MAFQLIESAAPLASRERATWSSWSAPAPGSKTRNSSNDPTNQEVISNRHDRDGQENGRHVGIRFGRVAG